MGSCLLCFFVREGPLPWLRGMDCEFVTRMSAFLRAHPLPCSAMRYGLDIQFPHNAGQSEASPNQNHCLPNSGRNFCPSQS